MNWTTRPVALAEAEDVARLRCLLWPELAPHESLAEVRAMAAPENDGTRLPQLLVTLTPSGQVAGFVELCLRSHADGCDVRHPVGYVEGWFVTNECRGEGVGKELMRCAEAWARERGCREMASDALIDNLASQQAHAALGFEVVDRCVHYRKPL